MKTPSSYNCVPSVWSNTSWLTKLLYIFSTSVDLPGFNEEQELHDVHEFEEVVGQEDAERAAQLAARQQQDEGQEPETQTALVNVWAHFFKGAVHPNSDEHICMHNLAHTCWNYV